MLGEITLGARVNRKGHYYHAMSAVRILFMLLMGFMVLLFAFVIILAVPALGVDFNCSFVASGSCANNASELGLFRVNSTDGSFNNSHVELMNYSGSYPYTLCCYTDPSHWLNYSCTDPNATTILGATSNTDAHVEDPSLGNYNYSACMALSPGGLSCEYVNTSCTAGYTPMFSMGSSESNDGYYNQTNAHIGNYTHYTLNVCCRAANAPPPTPTLIYPTRGNDSVIERNVTFDWSTVTDPDGDPVTYNFSLTQAICLDDNQSSLGASSYYGGTICVDRVYWWTVQACDTTQCSAWATASNFTIPSRAGITFIVNNTDFGALSRNATEDTTDDSPLPFTVENTGNVYLNVTMRALDPLFNSSGLGNDTFQYKAREAVAGAYTAAQESWYNVSASHTYLFSNLDYNDSRDSAYIDIGIDLPFEEEAGAKGSTLQLMGNYTG
jgi:hypothetical protein